MQLFANICVIYHTASEYYYKSIPRSNPYQTAEGK